MLILDLVLLLLAGVLSGSQEEFVAYSESIPGSDQMIELVPVPGGAFLMGSSESELGRSPDEGPQMEVQVDPFWMGTYEITWDLYDLFVHEVIADLRDELPRGSGEVQITSDAISTPTPPYVDMSFGMGREGFPAVSMTHYAAVMFTKWLSARTGNFYRLPTEAEWEYACRAGSQSTWHFGENSSELDRFAWHAGNSGRSYQRVGSREPNAYGIHDLSGNVAEWTMDQYREDYFELLTEEPADNPWIRPERLYPRAVRGGSWQDGHEAQRCAMRRGSDPSWKMLDPQLPKSLWWHTSAPFVGFRVVRPMETPTPEEMEMYWIEAMDDF